MSMQEVEGCDGVEDLDVDGIPINPDEMVESQVYKLVITRAGTDMRYDNHSKCVQGEYLHTYSGEFASKCCM